MATKTEKMSERKALGINKYPLLRELTYCPEDTYQFLNDINRPIKCHNYMNETFNKLIKPYCQSYEMHIEISDIRIAQGGKFNRYHAHGIITFYKPGDICRFRSEVFHKLNADARIEMSYISNLDSWNEYITKDDVGMQQYYSEYGLSHILTSKTECKKDLYNIPIKLKIAKKEKKRNEMMLEKIRSKNILDDGIDDLDEFQGIDHS